VIQRQEDLRTEAILFGRYLVDRVPSEELIERYVRANEVLGLGSSEDHEMLDFARRNPWSIAMLDAAAGVLGGSSLLRKKLLVMTAIVETTPELVDHTQPSALGLPHLALRVGVAGARTVLSVMSGLALHLMLRRRG
jgi:hypothetical protein